MGIQGGGWAAKEWVVGERDGEWGGVPPKIVRIIILDDLKIWLHGKQQPGKTTGSTETPGCLCARPPAGQLKIFDKIL